MKPLLLEIENRLERLEADVLSFPLDGKNDNELIQKKCRAEGAKKLLIDIKALLELKSK